MSTNAITPGRFKALLVAWCAALLCATGLFLTAMDGVRADSTAEIVLQIVLIVGLLASLIPAIGILLRREPVIVQEAPPPEQDEQPTATQTPPQQLAYSAPSLVQYERTATVDQTPTVHRRYGSAVPPQHLPAQPVMRVAPHGSPTPAGVSRSAAPKAGHRTPPPATPRPVPAGNRNPTPAPRPSTRSLATPTPISHLTMDRRLSKVGRVTPSATPVQRVQGPAATKPPKSG